MPRSKASAAPHEPHRRPTSVSCVARTVSASVPAPVDVRARTRDRTECRPSAQFVGPGQSRAEALAQLAGSVERCVTHLPAMLENPWRQGFAQLSEALGPVARASVLGFVQRRGDGRVAVCYSSASGFGEFLVADGDVPAVLRPGTDAPRQADGRALKDASASAIEVALLFRDARRVVSAAVADGDGTTRLWIGLPDDQPLSAERLTRFEGIASASSHVLQSLGVAPSDY